MADILEQFDRCRVAVLRGLGDQGAGDGRDIPTGEVQERVGERRAGFGELPALAHESISARVLLPAALVATAAAHPTRHDLHVTELSRNAPPTAIELSVQHDSAADPGSHGDAEHV